MKLKYTIFGLLSCIVLLGSGCQKNNVDTIDSSVKDTQLGLNPPTFEGIIKDSYLFVADNKDGILGEHSSYGVFGVKIDCSSFFPVDLSNSQILDLNLSTYQNKIININKYEMLDGKVILKEIKVDELHTKEIDTFKKFCPEPFRRYWKEDITQGGVSLYVRSLDESYKNILAEGKKIHIVEFKDPEFTEKGKIKNIFLTVPNENVFELEKILQKEANDKNVSGAKNLYGDFLPEERPKNGTTNFKIALIDVSILK